MQTTPGMKHDAFAARSAAAASGGKERMNQRVWLISAVVVFVAAAAILLLPGAGHDADTTAGPPERAGAVAGDPADRRGALVDEVVFTQESDPGKVTGQIETGSHHVFGQGVTSPTVFRRVRDSPRAAQNVSYGSSAELTLNPAGPELAGGELNPFHARGIREAVNWLIDRRYIADELYGGLAVPRYLPMNTAFPDYARLAHVGRALELKYRHDPERARRVITAEMEELGAEQRDGRWYYNGEPVRVSILIRTEDARRRVGDYVANLFSDLGFRVERMYRTAEEASRIWVTGDPNAGRWHIYTGGWVSTVINRDEAENFSFYYTPRGRPHPLWQLYDPVEEFDDIADRLQRREYDSWEERQEMMARGLELALEDSVRVWVADQLSSWPRAADTELAVDLAGGIAGSRLWPYTLRFSDRIGGRVVFALPSLLTEPWNPVAGSTWLFDTLMIRGTLDSELLPDPFTGLYWPQRIAGADVIVREGTPVNRTHDWLTLGFAESIEVPEETWIGWDHAAGRFRTVGEEHPDGLEARTRVRVHYESGYLDRQWHDGTSMSLADVVLPWILTFERADEESTLFDPGHLPAFQAFERHFRGWNIVSEDPLVIDIYSDQIYPDAETIVSARTPSVTPWHQLAIGIRAEQSGDLAFSSNKADRMQVEWMNMVSGPALRTLDRHLQRARGAGYIPFPEVLGEWLDADAAEERYGALAQWRDRRGHLWIGDGAFYLDSVHPVEGTAVLRRNEDFVDRGDKWLHFTEPRVPELELDGPLLVSLGEEAEFSLRVGFRGDPYPRDDIDSVQYLLFDGRGELVHQGRAEPAGEGEWRVGFDAAEVLALGAGANSLEVAVTSKYVALPAFATHVFASLPAASAEADP